MRLQHGLRRTPIVSLAKTYLALGLSVHWAALLKRRQKMVRLQSKRGLALTLSLVLLSGTYYAGGVAWRVKLVGIAMGGEFM